MLSCQHSVNLAPESVKFTSVKLVGLLGAESSELYSTMAASFSAAERELCSSAVDDSRDDDATIVLSVAMPPSRAALDGPPPISG